MGKGIFFYVIVRFALVFKYGTIIREELIRDAIIDKNLMKNVVVSVQVLLSVKPVTYISHSPNFSCFSQMILTLLALIQSISYS